MSSKHIQIRGILFVFCLCVLDCVLYWRTWPAIQYNLFSILETDAPEFVRKGQTRQLPSVIMYNMLNMLCTEGILPFVGIPVGLWIVISHHMLTGGHFYWFWWRKKSQTWPCSQILNLRSISCAKTRLKKTCLISILLHLTFIWKRLANPKDLSRLCDCSMTDISTVLVHKST